VCTLVSRTVAGGDGKKRRWRREEKMGEGKRKEKEDGKMERWSL